MPRSAGRERFHWKSAAPEIEAVEAEVSEMTAGKLCRMTLGEYPATSLAHAVAIHAASCAARARRQNTAESLAREQAERGASVVAKLADKYMELNRKHRQGRM